MAGTENEQRNQVAQEQVEVQEVKKKVDEQLAQAQTQAQKEALARKARDDLKSQEGKAKAIETKAIDPANLTPDEKKDLKGIRDQIVRVLHLIDKGILKPTTQSSTTNELFQQMKDQNVLTELTADNAVFIQPIIQKALAGNVRFDELVEQYKELQRKGVTNYNESLYKKFRDVLIKTGEKSGRSSDDLDPLMEPVVLTVRPENNTPLPAQTSPSQSSPISDIEQEYFAIDRKISNHLAAIPDEKKEERQEIRLLLEEYDRTPNAEDKAELLKKLDVLTSQELDRYIELRKQLPAETARADRGDLTLYSISDEDFNIFNPKTLIKSIESGSNEHFEKTPDGKLQLTDAMVKIMKRRIYDMTNKILQRASSQTSQEWNEVYDRYYEGAVMKTLSERIANMGRDSELQRVLSKTNSYREFHEFVNTLGEQVTREVDLRKSYHSVKRYFIQGVVGPEQIAKLAKEDPASKIATIMAGDDSSAALFRIALTEFERYIQYKIATNTDNEVPVELFAGWLGDREGYHIREFKTVRDNIAKKIDALQKSTAIKDTKLKKNLSKIQEWEIDRAMSFAPGFSFLNSMRIQEIIAMGRARKDFAGQYPFMQYFDITAKSRIGRKGGTGVAYSAEGRYGGDMVEGPGFQTSEILGIKIPMKEDMGSFGARMRRGWVPKKLYRAFMPFVDKNRRDLANMLDDQMLDRNLVPGKGEVSFKDALKNFNINAMYSRGSWRVDSLKHWFKHNQIEIEKEKYKQEHGVEMSAEEVKNLKKEKYDDDWAYTYDFLQKNVGASSRWMVDYSRATDEFKKFFLTRLLRKKNYQEVLNSYTSDHLDAIYHQYRTPGAHSRSGQLTPGSKSEIHLARTIGLSGRDGHMTVDEFIEEKELVYRGATFKALLERSPLDFMMTFMQLEPEMIKNFTVGDKQMSAYDFYFSDRPGGLTSAQTKQRNIYRESLHQRWGDKNIDHLAKISKTWADGIRYFDGYKANNSLEKRESKDLLYDCLTTAAEEVKISDKARMDENTLRSASGQHADKMVELFLSQGGLVDHFESLKEDFAQGDAKEIGDKDWGRIGDKKFFYQLAYRWFAVDKKGSASLVPNTNEMKQDPFFNYIQYTDDAGIFGRLWGDVDKYNKVSDELLNLDKLLLSAATSGKIDDIMKLHGTIQTLESSMGTFQANKLNYIVANAVTRFFQTDYKDRFPFPLSLVMGAFSGGRNKALSTIHLGAAAMTWKEEDIRNYSHELFKHQYIQEKGMWSKNMLEKAVGADTPKYALSAGTSIFSIIAMMTVFTLIQKAFEMEVSKEKKSS